LRRFAVRAPQLAAALDRGGIDAANAVAELRRWAERERHATEAAAVHLGVALGTGSTTASAVD